MDTQQLARNQLDALFIAIESMTGINHEKRIEELEAQNTDLITVVQGLIDFENTALMDDHVPSELIEEAEQILAKTKTGGSND